MWFSSLIWTGMILDFFGKINYKDFGKKSRKSKILATMKKIQDLGKKFKIIQDYPRSWQENQDAKHWELVQYTYTGHIQSYRTK